MNTRGDDGATGLGPTLAALGFAVLPHASHLPAWITLLLVAAGGWRWVAAERQWRLPSKGIRVALTALATLGIFLSYRTFNGLAAGSAFLVLMAGVKLLETRSPRDLTTIAVIGLADTGGNVFFAAAAAEQGLVSVVSVLASLYPVVTVVLARTYLREQVGRVQEGGAVATLAGIVLVSAG